MKDIKNYWLVGILILPGLAFAHAHLEKSVPAANSVVAAMPTEIELNFSEAARLTALTIEKEGGADKQVLKPAADMKTKLQVTAPKLGVGTYVLKWRVLSDDGHVSSGSVRFTVSGK